MSEWRLIKTMETNGAMQMAIDEAILTARARNLVPNTLRFFTWKPPCISVGFFQSLEQEIDVGKAKKSGIDMVRRYTGGGAVFHDRELTYSLAVSERDVPQDIIESYKSICGAVSGGLETLGIKAEFRPVNDIIVNSRKISGNAQTRRDGVVLQHGTILMDVDVRKMFSLLKVPDEKIRDKLIKSAEERVTSLNNELGRKVAPGELANALVKGFGQAFSARFAESGLTMEESGMAEKLCREKYSTEGWCHWR